MKKAIICHFVSEMLSYAPGMQSGSKFGIKIILPRIICNRSCSKYTAIIRTLFSFLFRFFSRGPYFKL